MFYAGLMVTTKKQKWKRFKADHYRKYQITKEDGGRGRKKKSTCTTTQKTTNKTTMEKSP